MFDLFNELSEEERKINEKRQEQFEMRKNASISNGSVMANRRKFLHASPNNALFNWESVFSIDECDNILNILRRHLLTTSWTSDRHSSYATVDIAVDTIAELREWLIGKVYDRIVDRICVETCFEKGQLCLIDLFIVRYSMDGKAGLKAHTDGSLFSFNVLLNHTNEFQGGGTRFCDLKKVYFPKTGDCIAHYGKILHAGEEITEGERLILVGFVDTIDTVHKPQIKRKAR